MKRKKTPSVARIAKTLKPRNPVIAALKSNPGATRGGPHGKTRSALRRAEKIALAREQALLDEDSSA